MIILYHNDSFPYSKAASSGDASPSVLSRFFRTKSKVIIYDIYPYDIHTYMYTLMYILMYITTGGYVSIRTAE